jgi:hypothetical protein
VKAAHELAQQVTAVRKASAALFAKADAAQAALEAIAVATGINNGPICSLFMCVCVLVYHDLL